MTIWNQIRTPPEIFARRFPKIAKHNLVTFAPVGTEIPPDPPEPPKRLPRMESMTKEERSAACRKAAALRWERTRAKEQAKTMEKFARWGLASQSPDVAE